MSDTAERLLREALKRLIALKDDKENIESGKLDFIEAESLKAYYKRNKDEAWRQARLAIEEGAARQAGQDVTAAPSQEGHAAQPAVAAPPGGWFAHDLLLSLDTTCKERDELRTEVESLRSFKRSVKESAAEYARQMGSSIYVVRRVVELELQLCEAQNEIRKLKEDDVVNASPASPMSLPEEPNINYNHLTDERVEDIRYTLKTLCAKAGSDITNAEIDGLCDAFAAARSEDEPTA